MTITTSEVLNLTADFRFVMIQGTTTVPRHFEVFYNGNFMGTVWKRDNSRWSGRLFNGKPLGQQFRTRKVAAHWLAVA